MIKKNEKERKSNQRSSAQEVQASLRQLPPAGLTGGQVVPVATIIMSLHPPLDTIGKMGVVESPSATQLLAYSPPHHRKKMS